MRMNKNTVLGWATLLMVIMGLLLIGLGVFKYSEMQSITSDYFIQLYYPLLSNIDILTTDELLKQKPKLIKDTNKLMKPKLFKKYRNISRLNASDKKLILTMLTRYPHLPQQLAE